MRPALALLLALTACATAPEPAGSPGGACPGSQEWCLSGAGRDCTWDKARGCEFCACRPDDRDALHPGKERFRPEGRDPAVPRDPPTW